MCNKAEAIKKDLPKVSVIPVCSEEKVARSGKTEPFGREQVQQKAFDDFFESLAIRLPLRCKSLMEKLRNDWKYEALCLVDDICIGGLNEIKIKEKIQFKFKALENNIEQTVKKEIEQILGMFENFSEKLGYLPDLFKNQKSSNNFFKQITTSLNWIEASRSFLSPFFMAFMLVTGKDESKKELKIQIDNAALKIDELIEKHVYDIELRIKDIHCKIINEISKLH